MKPNFALVLSNEGAELLQRVSGGWRELGTVDFQLPDRDQAIAALRDRARALAPDGLVTKLVVPHSEIRYETILAPGPTDEARRYQIEAEIERLTPYRLEDLAYDWSVEGEYVMVAVTAREILIELEEFAIERGFNPVCFVAIPEPGKFVGEPFFGESGNAARLFGVAGQVEPDAGPIRRLGPEVAAPSKPASDPAAQSAGTAAAPVRSEPPAGARTDREVAAPAKPERISEPDGARRAAAASASAADGRAGRKPAPAASSAASSTGTAPAIAGVDGSAEKPGKAAVSDLVRRLGTRLRREQASTGPGAGVGTGAGTAAPSRPSATGAASGPMAAVAAFVPGLRGKSDDGRQGAVGAALSGRDGRAYAAQPDADSGIEPEMPASPPREPEPADRPGDAAVIAFSSRRGTQVAGAVPDPQPGTGTARPDSSARPGRGATPGGRLAITQRGKPRAPLGRRLRGALRTGLANGGLLVPVRKLLGRNPDGSRPDASLAEALKVDPAPAAAAVASRSPSPRVTETEMSEAEALTLFGRRGIEEPRPLLSRPVLAVVGAVAALLVAVALWAVFLNRADSPGSQIAAVPGQDPVQQSVPEAGGGQVSSDLPASDPQITAPTQLAPAAPELTAPESAQPADDGALAAAPEPATPEPAAPELSAPEPAGTEPAGTELGALELAAPETAAPESAAPEAATAGEQPAADAEGPAMAAGSGIAPAQTGGEEQAAAPVDADARLETLVQEALDALNADPVTLPDASADGATADSQVGETAAAGATAGEAPAASGDAVAGAADGEGGAAARVSVSGIERLALPGRLEVPPVVGRPPEALPEPPPPAEVLAGIAIPGQTAGQTATAETDGTAAGGTDAQAPGTGSSSEAGLEIVVTAGRPAAVPPARPASIYTPPPEPAEPEAAAEPEAEAPILDDTPRADPALAGIRPQPRSAQVQALGEAMRAAQPEAETTETTAPEAAPEPAERLDQGSLAPSLTPLIRPASLVVDEAPLAAPPPGGMDLALLRPQRRPTDLVPEPGSEPPVATFEDAAPEAVATSLVPSSRPQNFSRRVEAALAAQRTRQAAPAAAASTAAAAAAPAPAVTAAAAAPNIPSSASVQREATQRRAISTRQANLIGVFGTPSNRRALVRMRNGSVVRLQVGDSFDGGRVSAIGENELRYQRGGRDRVLRIAG